MFSESARRSCLEQDLKAWNHSRSFPAGSHSQDFGFRLSIGEWSLPDQGPWVGSRVSWLCPSSPGLSSSLPAAALGQPPQMPPPLQELARILAEMFDNRRSGRALWLLLPQKGRWTSSAVLAQRSGSKGPQTAFPSLWEGKSLPHSPPAPSFG